MKQKLMVAMALVHRLPRCCSTNSHRPGSGGDAPHEDSHQGHRDDGVAVILSSHMTPPRRGDLQPGRRGRPREEGGGRHARGDPSSVARLAGDADLEAIFMRPSRATGVILILLRLQWFDAEGSRHCSIRLLRQPKYLVGAVVASGGSGSG